MAAVVTDTKVSVNFVLNNGEGKTVSVPLGPLNKDAFNADKVMALATAVTTYLTKTLLRVEKIVVSTITKDE